MSLPKHTLVFKIINDLDFGAENCLFLITKKKKMGTTLSEECYHWICIGFHERLEMQKLSSSIQAVQFSTVELSLTYLSSSLLKCIFFGLKVKLYYLICSSVSSSSLFFLIGWELL